MKYISTRGHGPVSFTTALMEGLAPDGGLYVPESLPTLSADFLGRMSQMTFQEMAVELLAPFVAPDMSSDELATLVHQAYNQFTHSEITPLRTLDADMQVLELFHGPTLAFKDVALQLLGLLFDWALEKQQRRLVVLGATSGDTGPAAIEGLKGRSHVDIFMLFPHARVSDIQRRQMTTVAAANVYPIAVKGTFDDAQAIVKSLFMDKELQQQIPLTAINSISWARLLPQMVYYAYAWSRWQHAPLHVSVPTGNFGDIYAGYLMRQMGLPLGRLLLANNSNDILTRFINAGDYSSRTVVATQSPSIDILVASNFERLLFDLMGRDAAKVRAAMATLKETGKLPPLDAEAMAHVRGIFAAHRADESEVTQAIAETHRRYQYLADPHTAVGLAAAYARPDLRPLVVLATASPAKFPEAVQQATGVHPSLPPQLAHLLTDREDFVILPATVDAVRVYMKEKYHDDQTS